jgi:hypothetical protein
MSTAHLVAFAAPRGVVPAGPRGRTLTTLLTTQVAGGAGLAASVTTGGLIAADLGGAGAAGLSFGASVAGMTMAVPLATAIRHWGRPRGLRLGWLGGAISAGTVVAATLLGSLPLLLTGMFLLGGADTSGAVARVAATVAVLPERRDAAAALVVSVTALTVVLGATATAHVALLAPGSGTQALAGAFMASATVFLAAGRALSAALHTTPAARRDGRCTTPATVPADAGRRTLTAAAAVAVVATATLLAAATPAAALLSVAALKLGVGFSLASDVSGVPFGRWARSIAGRARRAAASWGEDWHVTPVRACPA